MSRERFGSYSWEADNNQANLEKHGWSFESASIALDKGNPVPGNAREDGRQEHIASLNGETIKVVSEQQGGETQIISAHKNRDLAKEYDAKAAEQGITKNTEQNHEFAAWRKLDKEQQRQAAPAVEEIRQAQAAERQALDQRADLSPEQRAQQQADLAAQHKAEAVADRAPRLERDAQERSDLAIQQGRTVEVVPPAPTMPAADTPPPGGGGKLQFYEDTPEKKPEVTAPTQAKGGLQFYEDTQPPPAPDHMIKH